MENEEICNLKEGEKVAETAKLAGLLMLENGGETFRAEETVMKICSAGGYGDSEVIAIPTGVFITLIKENQNETSRTVIKRVKKRTINLYKLERANSISRRLVAGTIDFDEALDSFRQLSKSSNINKPMFAFIAGMSTGLFTLLYGGDWFDSIIAFICGFAVQYISSLFKRTDIYSFTISALGGMIISLTAVLSRDIFNMGNIDKIIIGSIIPLLPGLAMTSAIRDTMMGDLVSGTSRFSEVLLIGVAIASGVGVVFTAYIWFGGTL